jgi:hypothetical protein
MTSDTVRAAGSRELADKVVQLPARHQLVLRALVELMEKDDQAAGERVEALTGT